MKTIKKTKKRFRLAVGPAGPSGQYARLREIYHVSHVPTALRILEDKRIVARRVDDNSCLDTHRVSVTWMAPNRWPEKGSRYGTVEFAFDFAALVEGRQIYWVESVDDRSLDTCRMLISDRDVSHLPVKRYDPDRSEGPLRLIDGEWFWRNNLEFELMVEGDLAMSRCIGVEVVRHNREHCGRRSAYRCDEVNGDEIKTAARIVAGALAGRYRLPSQSLTEGGWVSGFLQRGWFGIVDGLDAQFDDIDGKVSGKQGVELIVTAALMQLADGNVHGATDTAPLVSSAKRVRSSLRRLLRRRTKVAIASAHADNMVLIAPVATGRRTLPMRRPSNRASPNGAQIGEGTASRKIRCRQAG